MMISLVSVAVGALGGGRASLDHAIGLHVPGWAGLLIAAGAGGAGAALVLVTSWRPHQSSTAA
jgi:putative oxidoreductase